MAALGYGLSDFVGGVAARRVAALRVVLVSYPLSVMLVLAIAPFVGGRVDVSALLWGALAGVVSGLAVWWFYLALAAGPMTVVSPLTALLVAVLPLATGMLLGERPAVLALVGACLALVAVVLVSRNGVGAELAFTPRVALLTLGSGTAFAGYFVLLHQVPTGTGLWPLLASRIGATAVVLVAAAGTGQLRAPKGFPLRLAWLAGVLDVVANTAFLYAVQSGLLSLVSVITALYPAATVA
ncbi:MAG: DMT family transporter, partial [Mycobacteriaceae bacterium]